MPSKKEKPTFIEEARRKQIVDAALQTIAGQGYSQTSFAEIAKSLGITKGLIAYHFKGKQDLIASVLRTIIDNQAAYLRSKLVTYESATDKLRIYIIASLEYIETNRAHFVALVDLWGSFTSPEEKRAFNKTFYGPCISQLQEIIQLGQQTGEFGPFDPKILTHILQGALDGVMLQWVFDPNVYRLTDCTDELVETFLHQVLRKS
ncbi:MAG: TetR/AcrR family transcriptional regulator [Anaerolineae bacterium]|nr:TetR/AcrR family transcriptional regulator [Anaerolineae bacterium]